MADVGKIRWGIVGTGDMAVVFARALAASRTGQLVAVASRSLEKAEAFSPVSGILYRHGSYEALLENPCVDVVFIALPHPLHARWCIRAAEAGKHILCEKPFTLNHAEAMAVLDAVRQHDVFLMENFAYRVHPQTVILRNLIHQETIGEIRLIRASYGFATPFDPRSRLFDPALGGGAILDLGGYPVSFARLIAGWIQKREFLDPIEVIGAGTKAESGVDADATALLQFEKGPIAQIACSMTTRLDNELVLFGSEGCLTVPRPFHPHEQPPPLQIRRGRKQELEEIPIPPSEPLFAQIADHVAAFLPMRQSPAMRWDDSLGNMRTLDRWRERVPVVYPAEQPETMRLPIHGRPLVLPEAPPIPRERLPQSETPFSRLILRTRGLGNAPLAFSLCDAFFESGGLTFDPGPPEAGGTAERWLGHWLNQRAIRNACTLIVRGGTPPFCTPEWLTRHLVESLDRLQTDHTDLYLLEHDNIEVPVGEFIEVLNEHHRSGRIRLFGAANWNRVRLEAANDYARKNNLQGFSAVSYYFGLAEMAEPPDEGLLSACSLKTRVWLRESRIPLFAWTANSHLFFEKASTAFSQRLGPFSLWRTPDNLERLSRLRRLAARRGGLSPTALALAYTLAQPFPTLAIIAPGSLPDLRRDSEAVRIPLSAEECAWLNLESDRPGPES
jgi:predicted dehydrogenase/aryl-alcohol dehydrogenase-like predicted oxidoreductase